MKKLLLFFCLLTTYGCQSSLTSNTSVKPTSVCPETPPPSAVLLKTENISIDKQKIVSGNVRSGEYVGYTFESKEGEDFSWSSDKSDLCVWVYSQKNDLWKGGKLPIKGKYTIQVTVPQGATTFNLDLKLGAVVAIPPPTPVATASASPSSIPTPTSKDLISEGQAKELVQTYLNSKSDIFGKRFKRDLAARYTTGLLLQDITKPGGSIDWLQSNKYYYTYKNSSIERVWAFANDVDPRIVVRVTEERTLYRTVNGNEEVDYSQSGQSIGNFTYYFSQDVGGTWKIRDFRPEG